jgi:hypothetical protein
VHRESQATTLVSPLRHFKRVQQPIVDLAAHLGVVLPCKNPERVQLAVSTPPAALQATLDADAGLQHDAARLYYALRVLDSFLPNSTKVAEGHAEQQACMGLGLPRYGALSMAWNCDDGDRRVCAAAQSCRLSDTALRSHHQRLKLVR